jgi:hypothetical protein
MNANIWSIVCATVLILEKQISCLWLRHLEQACSATRSVIILRQIRREKRAASGAYPGEHLKATLAAAGKEHTSLIGFSDLSP